MTLVWKKRLAFMSIFLALTFLGTLVSAEIEIYFAPDGGFHPKNNQRVIILKSGEKVQANLENALLDFIQRVEEGSELKIAMYAFGHRPTQRALIEAARDRNVKVKLILDAVATWTEDMRTDFKSQIMEEMARADKEGRKFDFQLKEIYPKAMVDRERWKKLEDGTKIYGTMHEKFGIVIPKGQKVPIHAFCGSANVSWCAGHVFGENRLIFWNEPEICKQLAEEFARLWNEYGTPVTENCQSEKFVPAPDTASLKIISNSKPLDEEKYVRIDKILMDMMDQVDKEKGTIDIAMFSFTHTGLANKILSLAEKYPKIKIRILMDQTQIEEDEYHQAVLGPYLEKAAYFKELKNIEVRYKWRSNSFAWDPQAQRCQLIHWRNYLLHHKCMVVNRNRMGIGSYNWSGSGEFRNFENLMVFDGTFLEHQKIIDRFMDEYDMIWDSLKKDGVITQKLPNPQVVTGPQGRKLKKTILETFQDEDCKNIMITLDKKADGYPKKVLQSITKIPPQVLELKLEKLEKATLIFQKPMEGDVWYQLAD